MERRDESQDLAFQPFIEMIITGDSGGRMGEGGDILLECLWDIQK